MPFPFASEQTDTKMQRPLPIHCKAIAAELVVYRFPKILSHTKSKTQDQQVFAAPTIELKLELWELADRIKWSLLAV
jgi:hypothetical protein